MNEISKKSQVKQLHHYFHRFSKRKLRRREKPASLKIQIWDMKVQNYRNLQMKKISPFIKEHRKDKQKLTKGFYNEKNM